MSDLDSSLILPLPVVRSLHHVWEVVTPTSAYLTHSTIIHSIHLGKTRLLSSVSFCASGSQVYTSILKVQLTRNIILRGLCKPIFRLFHFQVWISIGYGPLWHPSVRLLVRAVFRKTESHIDLTNLTMQKDITTKEFLNAQTRQWEIMHLLITFFQ